MGVGETITVINRSGKVVSSSKHIFGVFKEAKAAYRERKAEIKAERDAAIQEKKLKEGVKALRVDDDDARSHASSHRSKASHRTKSHRPRDRPTLERGYTDSFYANDAPRPRRHRYEQDLAGHGRDAHRMEIARRNSDMQVHGSSRRKSDVDMDLAYGDVPPPLPSPKYDDGELKEKASKITMLLDEANCLQYSATAMIENLQKNPEALAAVSLTLAEISSIVGKLGPGVLLTLKGSFPAVAALLLSPQFMIAGGVAVGVTIVALGGYKIIKKIQADAAAEKEAAIPMIQRARVDSGAGADAAQFELDELQPEELSRVEMWRRGIADIQADSAGTSVDGEFITPGASRTLVAAGVLDEDDLKSRRSERRSKGSKSHRAKSTTSVKTSKTSESRHSKTVKESRSSSKRKEKEPSGLKMLFRAHTAHV